MVRRGVWCALSLSFSPSLLRILGHPKIAPDSWIKLKAKKGGVDYSSLSLFVSVALRRALLHDARNVVQGDFSGKWR